ncbi:MAG: modification enzyme, MiaB family [Chloroflexi bacterium]|nr:modification enzyme, MiaB family [Chloroflexota bacterium]
MEVVRRWPPVRLRFQLQQPSESHVLSPPARSAHDGRPILSASIVTLGCKLNQAESYRVQVELARAGVDLRSFGEPVDLSIVNTCTVTHVADQQARQTLRRARRASPGGYVVAMGCYAQISPVEVAAVEGVDLVVTSRKEQLVGQLEERGLKLGDVGDGLVGQASPDHPVPLPPTRVRQFVKVQDGCDDYCTYCIVPFARGHAVSRPSDDIVGEVQGLVERGCREVVLTGVQIGAYGRDRYHTHGQALPAPGAPLAALVRMLLDRTAIPRIRISSIQPQDWPDDFLDLFDDPRLCQHLHLPLQSGSHETLRRMARRYSAEDFAALVQRIRARAPDAAITADVIVGFPGESDAEYRESLDFVRAMGFADAHVFRYSPRRGTAASRMDAQVPPNVKQARSAEMRAVAEESAAAFRRLFLGRSADVLWEEELASSVSCAPQPPPRWTGLTDNYLRVTMDSFENLLGKLQAVRLARLDGEAFQGVSVPGASH